MAMNPAVYKELGLSLIRNQAQPQMPLKSSVFSTNKLAFRDVCKHRSNTIVVSTIAGYRDLTQKSQQNLERQDLSIHRIHNRMTLASQYNAR